MMNRKYRTGKKMFLAALLVVVSLVSLAQERIFELTPESFESRIVIEYDVPFERVFPHLKIERISKKITNYEKPNFKRGYFSLDADRFLIMKDKKTFIRIHPEMRIYSFRSTPNYKRGLFYYSDGRFSVFSLHDGNITILPAITRKNTSTISWYWKTNDSLIGVADECSPEMLKPNRYPETDIIPEKIFFFLYEFNEAGGKMYYISDLPKTRRGNVIRLEGITPKGGLVLSEIHPDEYWNVDAPGRMLGVFDIAPPRSESK